MELRPLLVIDVAVRPITELGAFPLGDRRVVVFDGGTFEGRDGLREIDAHYLLVTDGGDQIEVRSRGLRKASAEVAERIGRGEDVPPSQYYFRTHIRLSTSSTRYAWMNDLLAVSTGERRRDRVRIDVHEIG